MPEQAAPTQLAAPRRPCRLVLLEDAGGPRYFLDGRAVHAGELLEVLMGFSGDIGPDGSSRPRWLTVRFEWSGRFGTRPSFCFDVPDRFFPYGVIFLGLPAHMTLPEGALFRRCEP